MPLTKEMIDLQSRVETMAKDYEDLRSSHARLLANASPTKDFSSQAVLKSFGLRDIKQVFNCNLGHPKYRHAPIAHRYQLSELKKDLMISRWVSQMYYEPNNLDFSLDEDHGVNVKSILDNFYAKQVDLRGQLKAFCKDMTTITAGEGLEWVPTIIGSQYIEEYELDLDVHKIFQIIDMPAGSYEHPIHKNRKVARGIVEAATGTGVSMGTGSIAFAAKKLFEYYPISEELTENSAANILTLGRSEVVKAQLRAYDEFIVSGDLTATHQDSDVTAADDARKFVNNGLRKRALDNSANGSVIDFLNAGVTDANLKAMRTAMGRFGVRHNELMWIFSPVSYLQAIGLDEVSSQDKIGNDNTMQRGYLDYYRGMPLIQSEALRDDLNASGVYDGVTTDRSSALIVNHTRFMFGRRRPIRVKVARDPRPELDRWQLVSYSRVDWNGFEQAANEVSVVYGINIQAG
jgi:hypothetical protein